MTKILKLRRMAIVACLAVSSVFVACEDPWNDNGGNGGETNSKVPTGVTATANSSSSITITWNAVTDVYSYKIYRSDNASGPYAEIGNTWGKPTYTNTNLSAATTFYYKVATSEGAQSASVSSTTFFVAPTGVKAKSETSSSVTISWNNIIGATDYRIYRYGNGSNNYSDIGTSTSNSYTDIGLPSNVNYTYAVSGYNSITEGDKSWGVSATTLLKAPTGVTATANSASSITISWNAVTDAHWYKIVRSDNEYGLYTEIKSYQSGTSYINTNLSSTTTFYYKVAAHNGEESVVVSATTL